MNYSGNSLSFETLRMGNPMREADKRGQYGQAWLIPPTKKEQQASLGTWLVNVPEAHQFWSWWAVSVVHLREADGLPAPFRQYEGAEYEFSIMTVDSEEEAPSPIRAEEEGLIFIGPPDVVEQFHGVCDSSAARIAEASVHAILSGDISPDSDYREHWKQKLDTTIKSLRLSVN